MNTAEKTQFSSRTSDTADTQAQHLARILLEAQAVQIDVAHPFTFASGIKSPVYCDNRRILAFPQQRQFVSECFVKRIDAAGTDIIAGVATAGIPWACFVGTLLQKPVAYVRAAAKEHGTRSAVEGAAVKGKRVVLIEDLISTGKSSIAAVKTLKEAGAHSVSLKALFSYQFETARIHFENENCPFESLSNFTALITLLQTEGRLRAEDVQAALEWNKAPEQWAEKRGL